MTAFQYNLVPYNSGAALPSGSASYSNNNLYISPINAADEDKTAELRAWLAQADPILPVYLEITYEVPGDPITSTYEFLWDSKTTVFDPPVGRFGANPLRWNPTDSDGNSYVKTGNQFFWASPDAQNWTGVGGLIVLVDGKYYEANNGGVPALNQKIIDENWGSLYWRQTEPPAPDPTTVTELIEITGFEDRLDETGDGLPALILNIPGGIGGGGGEVTLDTGTIDFDFASPPVGATPVCGPNRPPCPPDTYCFAEECVPVSTLLRDDDLMIVFDGTTVYSVAAVNYLTEAPGKTTVVIRDGVAYSCPALGANILDDDSFPVWRPSAGRTYSVSGKKFKEQFS